VEEVEEVEELPCISRFDTPEPVKPYLLEKIECTTPSSIMSLSTQESIIISSTPKNVKLTSKLTKAVSSLSDLKDQSNFLSHDS